VSVAKKFYKIDPRLYRFFLPVNFDFLVRERRRERERREREKERQNERERESKNIS
jgi:hypothetical protein